MHLLRHRQGELGKNILSLNVFPRMYLEIGDGSQRAHVYLMADRDIRVVWKAVGCCREVANAVYRMPWKDVGAESCQVEPFVECASNGTIIEIEAIDINVGRQLGGGLSKMRRPPFRAVSRPTASTVGGVHHIHYQVFFESQPLDGTLSATAYHLPSLMSNRYISMLLWTETATEALHSNACITTKDR